MATPINLNKARKERDRSSRKARAEENSVRFGQTKAQKERLKAQADKIARNLEAHKRDP